MRSSTNYHILSSGASFIIHLSENRAFPFSLQARYFQLVPKKECHIIAQNGFLNPQRKI